MVKALKMYGDDGGVIFNEHWCTEGGGKWLTSTIPKGKEIIGLQVFLNSKYIPGITFLLWEPYYRKKN